MAKIKLEDIKKEVEEHGWSLVSEEYQNLEAEMVFECSEGHRIYGSWKKIRAKWECPICKNNVFKEMDSSVISKKKGTNRVLALDQATKITGWSIYDDQQLVKYGIFETDGDKKEIERDVMIKVWLVSMIENWVPDYVGIEGIQYQANFGVTTFETLARLQGILMATLYELNIPYEICPTPTWRAHCKVKGKTRPDKKRSMQLLAKEWFDISVTDDAADAIGIGKYLADKTKQFEVTEWE